jgi:F420-0:gamma-glutamyl ligase-like protein
MEAADVEKAGEVKTQKLLAKLPGNYSALTPEEQAKWRSDLAQRILQRQMGLDFLG